MEPSTNMYSRLSLWIARNLSLYDTWTEQVFDDLLEQTALLPSLDGDEQYRRFKESHLEDNIKKLVFEIGVAPYADEEVDFFEVEIASGRLMKLWGAYKRFAISTKANSYAAFLLAALRNQTPARLLVDIASSAKTGGLTKGDFYWSTNIRQRLERHFVSEAFNAISGRDSDYLREVFDGADKIGRAHV